jgi:hypothetical protein
MLPEMLRLIPKNEAQLRRPAPGRKTHKRVQWEHACNFLRSCFTFVLHFAQEIKRCDTIIGGKNITETSIINLIAFSDHLG